MLVSPEGIDPDGEAEGRSRGADAFRGETRPSEARAGEPGRNRTFNQLRLSRLAFSREPPRSWGA
jgi:hypothetical protein